MPPTSLLIVASVPLIVEIAATMPVALDVVHGALDLLDAVLDLLGELIDQVLRLLAVRRVGLAGVLRSSASVFVASVTSSTALLRLFSDRLPP